MDCFKGGGTYFEHSNKIYCIDQGDALVHSGKQRHAGYPITQGFRMILVGFVDAGDYLKNGFHRMEIHARNGREREVGTTNR